MTVMEYMARFTELTRFGDDYVATDMAKVRRFENGLKLSIRDKIVGLRLQDMDSLVMTALAIEREMDDAQGIRDESAGGKRKEDQPSSNLGVEVKAFREARYRCSSLGCRVRVDLIGRNYELEISKILLMVDLRVVDIVGFDVVLDKDELTTHRVVNDYDLRQVIIPDTVLEL